jgi:hypothetical protein
MNRTLLLGIYIAGTAFAWLTLGRLIVAGNVAERGMTSSYGLLTLLLVLVAPGATFIPLAHWARAPLYDIEGMLGWGVLALTLAFLEPSDPPTLAQFLLFLLPLTVAIATGAALLSYLTGLRVYRDDPRRHDFIRARRQGYLAAFSLIAIGLLHSVGTLSPATGTLLVAIAVLAEMFALSRARASIQRPTYENTRAR